MVEALMVQHAGPRQSALALLPHLLSNPPFIPTSLTSSVLNRRHQILNTSPEDVEEYLVTDAYPTEYHTARRTVEMLLTLAAQVDIVGAVASAQDNLDMLIGKIQFKCPEEGVIFAGVELGTLPVLTLLLRLEGNSEGGFQFKYDNLLPINVVPGPWFDSLEEATSARYSLTTAQKGKGTAKATTEASHTDRDDEKDDEDQQVESEYITDPNDFWAGYASDEEKEEGGKGNQGDMDVEESEEERQRRMEQEEDRYWAMYDKGTQDNTTSADTNEKIESKVFGEEGQRDFLSQVDQYNGNQTTSRDEAIKMIIKGAYMLMKGEETSTKGDLYGSQGDDNIGKAREEEFLRLTKEAMNECE